MHAIYGRISVGDKVHVRNRAQIRKNNRGFLTCAKVDAMLGRLGTDLVGIGIGLESSEEGVIEPRWKLKA